MNKETSKTEGNNIIFDSKDIKSLNENNSILTGNNNTMTKSIKDELIYFKNDILKDVKESLSKFHNKYVKKLNDFEEKLNETHLKSDVCYQKIEREEHDVGQPVANIDREAAGLVKELKNKVSCPQQNGKQHWCSHCVFPMARECD